MNLAWILLFLPLVVAAVNQLVLRKNPLVPWVSTASAVATLVISFLLLGKNETAAFNWATIGDDNLQIGIKLDQLSTGMMIVVTGIGMDGAPIEIDADAFEARAIQHELDHLDGLLFLDRVVAKDRVFRRRTYR